MRYIARPTIFLRDSQRLHQVPAGEIGTTDIPDFTGLHQVSEGTECLFDWSACVEPVELKKVDIVGAKPAKTAFYGVDDVEPGGADIVRACSMPESRLGGDQHLIPASSDGGAEHFLGCAVRIDIRRIEHRQSRLKADIDQMGRPFDIGFSPGPKEFTLSTKCTRSEG